MTLEPRITCFDGHIWQLEQPLNSELPLHVHLVVGDMAVLVDTGLASTYPHLSRLFEAAGVRPSDVRLILNTHGHHDHIGSNRRVKADTGALVAAAPGTARWIEDFDIQIREFAFHHPEIIPDTPEVRRDIEDTMDGEVRVDILLDEGTSFQLGQGVELRVLSVPGHVPAELAYYERSTATVILGDAVTGIDWSFFHGHMNPAAYRASLRKLRAFAANHPIDRALLAHYPLLDRAEFLALLGRAEAYIDGLDRAIVGIVGEAGPGGVDLETVWRAICQQLRKQLEFRGLAMTDGHLRDLSARGQLARIAPDRFALVAPGRTSRATLPSPSF
jgi:glyoxylase-like metal-dependent hydrolase (beta-lactamase superfamily II)